MEGRVDETSVVDGGTEESYHDASGAEEGPRRGTDGLGRREGGYIYKGGGGVTV